ncbi:MAG: serine/threonine-protein kinase [Exilibacterium sp.]
MDVILWNKVKILFDQLLELPAEKRTAYLHKHCQEAEVKNEVLQLLSAEAHSADYLTHIVSDSVEELLTDNAFSLNCGDIVGKYRLETSLGQGGMGKVFLAHRSFDGFQQKVAIKITRIQLFERDHLSRFNSERNILAKLNHPNIARFLDGGTTTSGIPYLVMEYIEGEPIDIYCGRRRLSLKERLRLFQQICSAVQYTHQNLIVHRDIKPSNVLVTADGTVKLLDFGIAKILQPETYSDKSVETQMGILAMTPNYASPEQIRGETITTRSDIYSLGVLLYYLLTARHPNKHNDVSETTDTHTNFRISAIKPSHAVVRSSEADIENERNLGFFFDQAQRCKYARTLHGDIDTILLKALLIKPEHRYQLVAQLSGDIENHLTNMPIAARPLQLALFTAQVRYASQA